MVQQMVTDKIKKLEIIFNPKFIILFYLGVLISTFAYSILVLKQHDMHLVYVRLGFLTIYGVLAILAFRGKKVAVWIIAVFVFLSGIAGLSVSLGMMNTSQWVLNTVFSLLGAYFVCSAFSLIRKRNRAARGR